MMPEVLGFYFLQIEPIRNFFAALFLASIGMLIHVHFLWNHVDILLAAVILVIIIKTAIIAIVVKGFGYNNKTSLLVSIVYHFPVDLCTGVNIAKIPLSIFFKYF
jgi:Kef-type K+ transport system membrane component KefB